MQHHGPVHMQIGKNGITQGAIEELTRQFEHSDPLKIKLLKSFTDSHDRKKAAFELAERTESRVLDQTGGVVLLTKR